MPRLCHIDDIQEDASKGFDLTERQLFAIKKEGEIYLYQNRCPHLGVPLEWQENQFLDMDNSLIQCSSHGALFLIESGVCIAGPCNGEKLIPVAFHIDNGHIVVTD